MLSPIRRGGLAAAILAAIAFAAPLASAPAQAAAPQVKTQVPGYYRMMVGKFELTALFDGRVALDAALLKHASQRDVQRLLAREFAAGDKMQTAVNAYLVNTGDKLVLIDTGAAKAFGPTLGQVADNLRAAGYTPEQVDEVLLTHLHGDHAAGLLSADGKAAFPNATVRVAKAEADFWLSAERLAAAPEGMKPFFQMAQAAAAPYQAAGRLVTFDGQALPIAGISARPGPGHTPGHTAYEIQSGDARLLVWGDIVHNAATQFTRPEITIEFDTDQKLAAETRKQFFAYAAKEKLPVAGAHLPFPGIGRVRKDPQGGYDYVPQPFAPVE